MKKLILFMASCIIYNNAAAPYLSAIEIPLEGFGKSTKIAYVNMNKIFEAFPQTEQARVELNKLIEEKKESITERKEEIAKLKGEIELLKKKMAAVSPDTQSRAASQPVQSSTVPEATTGLSPSGVTSLSLPAGSPLGFLFTPPATATATVPPETQVVPSIVVSTQAPSILPGIPSPAPQLKEKEDKLWQMESELDGFVGRAEEELKVLQEGKTLTLMAKIYKTIEEYAAQEGYSVIVDKETILYGEGAVDITQSIIWKLSEPGRRSK